MSLVNVFVLSCFQLEPPTKRPGKHTFIMLADLTDAELVQWFSKFKKLVPLKDKRIAFKTYKDSFSGKKAVKVIIEHFNLEKERAKELAQLVRRLILFFRPLTHF